MRKFVIPYSRKRENPDYGKSTYVPGPTSVEEVYRDGVLVSKTLTHAGFAVESRDSSPYWLYDYPDFEVECCHCGAKFDHTELEFDDLIDDDDEERWTYTKCPRCRTWDCCEVEYEK